uniref:Uncharacterized protein n=1 Tax=Quercus lobata TaxID=97700 RepID=A0A7N2MXB3_QUELO
MGPIRWLLLRHRRSTPPFGRFLQTNRRSTPQPLRRRRIPPRTQPRVHDYVLMRRDRGVLYMSEVDIGLTFPDYFTALMRSKISSASARRDILLVGRKVKGEEAVRMGIVDSVTHDSEESVVEAAVRLGE